MVVVLVFGVPAVGILAEMITHVVEAWTGYVDAHEGLPGGEAVYEQPCWRRPFLVLGLVRLDTGSGAGGGLGPVEEDCEGAPGMSYMGEVEPSSVGGGVGVIAVGSGARQHPEADSPMAPKDDEPFAIRLADGSTVSCCMTNQTDLSEWAAINQSIPVP